jgi:glutamate N-acetyltransferase/amino-acid N-acetyltransferase
VEIEIDWQGTATSPLGYTAGVAACGLKESGSLDLGLLYSGRDCTAAGAFTQNKVAAAPVILDRQTLAANSTAIRGIVANAGIANACTGEQGFSAAQAMQQASAESFGCRSEQFLVLSTGVIGVQLPLSKVRAGLRIAKDKLAPKRGLALAQAIMTTDTRPKHLAVKLQYPDGIITIGGMAKGAGMIHPDMATMLAVMTTDAEILAATLQNLLAPAIDRSFNSISIDGDTSTNDTVLLLANGASGVRLDDPNRLEYFIQGLEIVSVELAKMIVRDGEGVSKFVTIWVSGARSSEEAKLAAQTIATSPLVKTALAGSDPNWGRILAAAGRSGVDFDQNCLILWIGNPNTLPLQLVAGGMPTGYSESQAATIFSRSEITIHLDLGQGKSESTVWTGDLTHDYITINSDYRT